MLKLVKIIVGVAVVAGIAYSLPAVLAWSITRLDYCWPTLRVVTEAPHIQPAEK